MSSLKLYSPVNFLVGVQVVLAKRSQLEVRQAIAEVERESPGWPARLASSLLTGALLLYVLMSALPHVADQAMAGLTQLVTPGQSLRGIATVVTLAALLLVLAKLRSAWRFYVAMCRIGYATRFAP